jgi:hypothetical protein
MTNVLISPNAGIDFFSDEEIEWETFGNSESIDSMFYDSYLNLKLK